MNVHQRNIAVMDGDFTPNAGSSYHVVRRLNDVDDINDPSTVGDRTFLVQHTDGRREVKAEAALEAERPYKRHNGCLISADCQTPPKDQRFGYVLEPLR